MKKLNLYIFFAVVLILLNLCAKPTVINVTLPDDQDLNCGELKKHWLETRRFKKEAERVRDPASGANMTRTILFWPALAKTLHNAEVAIKAADDRAFHLINIMRDKNCEEAEEFYAELIKKTSPFYISAEIKRLNKLYKSGVLTEEEFEMAKKKVLSQ